jgi:hypothetical protein
MDSTNWPVSKIKRPTTITKNIEQKNIEQKNKKKKYRENEEWRISNKIKPLPH